jgi:hypothetical protein
LIAALDNTFLSLVLNEKAKPRPNPATGQPIDYWKERIDSMIDAHSSNNDTIIIPTPCLAEMLTAIPSVAKAIEVIEQSRLRTHNQNMTVAARAIAERKTVGDLS